MSRPSATAALYASFWVTVASTWPCISHAQSQYEKQMERLDDLTSSMTIGTNTNYYLMKEISFYPGFAKVGFIFGLLDNRDFCSDLADLYQSKYPASRMWCVPTNDLQ